MKCCSSARRMSTARRPNSPPPKPGRTCATYCDRAISRFKSDACDGLRAVVRSLRPFVQPAEPQAHAALRRSAGEERPDRRARLEADLLDRRQALPAGPLRRRHVPRLRLRTRARRSMRQLQTLLDPIHLKNPRSKISGSTNVEPRDTAHLFLKQPKMQERIRAWVDKATDWPPLARSIAYKWLDEGLIDRSITRDLFWGIKVTKDGKVRARASRAKSITSGSMRRSNTSARPSNGPKRPAAIGSAGGAPTKAPTTSPTSSSWARTTSPSTP